MKYYWVTFIERENFIKGGLFGLDDNKKPNIDTWSKELSDKRGISPQIIAWSESQY